jgi:hypothetical protein
MIGVGISPFFLKNFTGGIVPPPPPYIIATSTSQIINSISGLFYIEGFGPSNESGLFRIQSEGLTPSIGNITITPSSNVEFFNGSVWQSTPFNLPYTGSSITTSLIYKVRIKAGLPHANYNETLTLSGGDAADFIISIHGSVILVQEYYLRLQNSGEYYIWRDGLMIDELDNIVHLHDGWNPSAGFADDPVTNEHYISSDLGETWVQQANAPWPACHCAGHGVYGGYIWRWGQDAHNPGNSIWKYDGTTYSEVLANWDPAIGNRVGFSYYIDDDGYKYIIGGNDISYTIYFTDIWKLSPDGLTSEFVNDLPSDLLYFTQGVAVKTPAGVYLMSGARYAEPISTDFNSKVYFSADNFQTITEIGTLPIYMRGTFASAMYFDSEIWFGMSTKINGNNGNQIWHSPDGLNWTEFITTDEEKSTVEMEPTHAGAMTIVSDTLLFVPGNDVNKTWMLRKASYLIPVDKKFKWWYNALFDTDVPSNTLISDLNNYVQALGDDFYLHDLLAVVAGMETDSQRLVPLRTTSYKRIINEGVSLSVTGVRGRPWEIFELRL